MAQLFVQFWNTLYRIFNWSSIPSCRTMFMVLQSTIDRFGQQYGQRSNLVGKVTVCEKRFTLVWSQFRSHIKHFSERSHFRCE